MRAALTTTTLCVALLAGATAAYADEDADREAAKVAFQKGDTLFSANDYAAALAAFRQAQQLRPHDKVRIPIATCLERLARFREAIVELQFVVESAQVTAEQQLAAKETIARLEPRLGTLVVSGQPRGAQVLVDERPRCEVPCRVQVDPREHVIEIRHGALARTERRTFTRGAEITVEVNLSSKPASVSEPTTLPNPVSPAPSSSEPNGYAPGALTWIGAGLAAVGVAGIIGFGVHADARHESYVATPTQDLLDEGVLARNLANASIAVAGVGAVLLLVDLIFIAPDDGIEAGAATGATGFQPSGWRISF